jgi:hypothetical protein
MDHPAFLAADVLLRQSLRNRSLRDRNERIEDSPERERRLLRLGYPSVRVAPRRGFDWRRLFSPPARVVLEPCC